MKPTSWSVCAWEVVSWTGASMVVADIFKKEVSGFRGY
jgi:hypothetical protein